jgi:arylsulfatase A-like enzyme
MRHGLIKINRKPTSFITLRGDPMRISFALLTLCFCFSVHVAQAATPNIIFILADDLGYGDLGCYGQEVIQTPRLDQMAKEGMRFTQFYAGCTVCAPSRCVLMTGLHNGHAYVRGNASGENTSIQSLRDEDITVAEIVKSAGYRTGLIGKWGLGEVDQPGFPLRQGFDFFYGYLNQIHAHNYYPEFLYRNAQREKLRNEVELPEGQKVRFLGGSATKRVDYSHDLFAKEALDFVKSNHDQPFFLYLALTTPHANNEASKMRGNGAEVPDFGIYAERDWTDADKGQAAMITRMDRDIGQLLDLLKQLNIDDKTLVFFSSDNGPHDEAKHDLKRFKPSGPLKGIKRSLTEGGIRVPLICRWPGSIAPGTTSDHVGQFCDILPTVAELTGAKLSGQTDGLSMLPTLLGRIQDQQKHDYLYWEFYEQGSRQSVRFEDWVAIREPMFTGRVSLYNLKEDLMENRNLADELPELVTRAKAYLDDAHRPNPNWAVRGTSK